jgi:hypothetical protein
VHWSARAILLFLSFCGFEVDPLDVFVILATYLPLVDREKSLSKDIIIL